MSYLSYEIPTAQMEREQGREQIRRACLLDQFAGFAVLSELVERAFRLHESHNVYPVASKARPREWLYGIPLGVDLDGFSLVATPAGDLYAAAPSLDDSGEELLGRYELEGVELWAALKLDEDNPLQDVPQQADPAPDSPRARVFSPTYNENTNEFGPSALYFAPTRQDCQLGSR